MQTELVVTFDAWLAIDARLRMRDDDKKAHPRMRVETPTGQVMWFSVRDVSCMSANDYTPPKPDSGLLIPGPKGLVAAAAQGSS